LIILKHGVSTFGIRPELLLALVVVDAVYRKFNHDCVVTSLSDGQHSSNSLHYKGLAFDTRTRQLTASQKTELRDMSASALGKDYDVVLESDHLHVEFDPKR